MEMYYLVIALWSTPVVIPDKYTKEECEKIGHDRGPYMCIPAPKEYYNCATMIADPTNPSKGISVKSHCDIETGKN